MIAAFLFAAGHSIYWHLPVMVLLVSLVYSATRFDDWSRIGSATWRGAVYIVTFMGIVFAVLLGLSTLLPMFW